MENIVNIENNEAIVGVGVDVAGVGVAGVGVETTVGIAGGISGVEAIVVGADVESPIVTVVGVEAIVVIAGVVGILVVVYK